MKKIFNMRVTSVVLASVFVGSLATVGVYAAIPNSNTGVISACRDNVTGALRAIDAQSGATCNGSESALKWSSQIKGNLMIDSLHDADLSGARLQYLDLQGVSFKNSDFSDAKLTGSNLKNADFSGAILTGGVNLNRIKANNANFSGAILQMITNEAVIRNADFSYATVINIEGGDYTDSSFTYSELGTIADANFTNVDFRNSTNNQAFTINNVNMTGANFSGVIFTESSLIANTNLTNADYSNVVFTPQSALVFSSVNATNVNFSGVSFVNVTFNETDLSTAGLDNTTWSNVVCPDGTNSDNNGATCLGHLTS